MLQTTPVQNQTGYGAMLPDASDRASSIVGFDINKYVFGEDSFSLQNPSGGLNQTNQNPVNQTVLNNGNNMPRLLGVDIPNNKRVEYALQYIYGIGPARAKIICAEAGIAESMRASELNEELINKIMNIVTERQYKLEGDLRREIVGNMKRLSAIKSYRGLRHAKGLPVRGQRTSTNARTRKGARKTVGVVTKK